MSKVFKQFRIGLLMFVSILVLASFAFASPVLTYAEADAHSDNYTFRSNDIYIGDESAQIDTHIRVFGSEFSTMTLDPSGGMVVLEENGERVDAKFNYAVELYKPMPNTFYSPDDINMSKLNVPTREGGYLFNGYWDTKDTGGKQYYGKLMQSVNDWDKTDGATLYARWIAKNFVQLDQTGGVNGSESVVVVQGNPMDTSVNPPVRAMYRFLGYWDTPSGDGKQYYDAEMNSVTWWDKDTDATLYARWDHASAGEGFGILDYNDHATAILAWVGIGSVIGIIGCLTLLYIAKKKRKVLYQ